VIHVVTALNRHLYEDVIEQHFRIRHEIFVEERGWEALRKPDGREVDSYDNEETVYLLALEDRRVVGGQRLYPTTKPSMMSEIFPHLAAVRGCPVDPLIWECSRYFIVSERREGILNLQLLASVQEFCLDHGIVQFSAIIETWWLPRLHEAGFVATPLGLPALIENAWTMAAVVDVSHETLYALRERIGAGPMLRQEGPRLDVIARANFHNVALQQRRTA
jgi:acyl-homoserine lactone synthase